MLDETKRRTYLRDVLMLALSAFGGPFAHLALMQERLVERRQYLSNEELLELNALCQFLPGPTSTQTITAVGLKLGGQRLALLTLLLWILKINITAQTHTLRETAIKQPLAHDNDRRLMRVGNHNRQISKGFTQ